MFCSDLFKKIALEYDLIIRKDDISFLWKYDIIFQVEKWNMAFLFWKMVFQKTLHWNMIFLISWGKITFHFPENMISNGKWKMIFLKKYMKIWYFLFAGKGGISFSYKCEITFLLKKQRWSFTKKMHLKMTLPVLLKKMIFILEKMTFAFSVLLWRPFEVFSYIVFQ